VSSALRAVVFHDRHSENLQSRRCEVACANLPPLQNSSRLRREFPLSLLDNSRCLRPPSCPESLQPRFFLYDRILRDRQRVPERAVEVFELVRSFATSREFGNRAGLEFCVNVMASLINSFIAPESEFWHLSLLDCQKIHAARIERVIERSTNSVAAR
jgi:hypothetical protein